MPSDAGAVSYIAFRSASLGAGKNSLGLPFGLWIINRLPSIMTLRPQEATYVVTPYGLVSGVQQRSFLVRAIWFLVVGWWLSGAWMALAYACLITIVLMPVAFWMYGRVGAVSTLYRS